MESEGLGEGDPAMIGLRLVGRVDAAEGKPQGGGLKAPGDLCIE